MEQTPIFENRENDIEQAILGIAEAQRMTRDEIITDIATYAPHPKNREPNSEYFVVLSEMTGVSADELHLFAVEKYEQIFGGQEN